MTPRAGAAVLVMLVIMYGYGFTVGVRVGEEFRPRARLAAWTAAWRQRRKQAHDRP